MEVFSGESGVIFTFMFTVEKTALLLCVEPNMIKIHRATFCIPEKVKSEREMAV